MSWFRPRSILIAAVVGAALPVLLLAASSVIYDISRAGKPGNVLESLSGSVDWLLAILSNCILPGGNPWIVDPLIGAVVFGFGTFCWQFMGQDELKD